MKTKLLFCLFVFCAPRIVAHEVSLQTGLLKNSIAPAADFAVATYKHGSYRIGAFTAPEAQGIVASYSSTDAPFMLELGQRERSLDQGFIVSNGAYLPWTKNFAFAEPMGARAGYRTRYGGVESAYYQREDQNIGAANLFVSPVSWFKVSGGVAAQNLESSQGVIPLMSALFGESGENLGFKGGGEYAGPGNFLLHARYAGDFTVRALGFKTTGDNPLASGIYAEKAGGAVQFFSKAWFAQYFHTTSRFGMARYAGEYLTGVAVYEEKTQMAGFSLRNSATGFHLRGGATLGADSSLQTLAGLGYADFIFIGGGHFKLSAEQPLEPMIFPSDWYSSLLLQSTGMRIKDSGFKMLALVNTEVVQGFFAVTYAEDARGRERFGFFLRIAGSLTF